MAEASKNTVSIGFLDILGILFIGLKLTNFITWSWWWVLLPLYGPVTVVFGIWVVSFVAIFIGELLKR